MLNRTINKDQKDYYFSKAYVVPTGLSNNDNGELTGHFELFIDAIEFKKVSEKEDEVRITMIPERILNPEFTEKNPLIESLEQQVSIFNPMMQMFLSEEEVEKLRTRLVWQNGEPNGINGDSIFLHFLNIFHEIFCINLIVFSFQASSYAISVVLHPNWW